MAKETAIKNLHLIFKNYPSIKLVYFFGSRAAGQSGPLSDYDFAFYLDEKEKSARFDIKFQLFDVLSRKLKTDKVDVVILNDTQSPELKYNIIKNGILIYAKEPFKVLLEPKIMNEYFDFRDSLARHGLTKA